MRTYNHRNCKSLFGYAASAHAKSRGRCQLCDCGGPPLDFDLWRQFTIEHIIPRSQGGHLKSIRASVSSRFPNLSAEEQGSLAKRLDEANTVSACGFCNSTTSHTASEKSMDELLNEASGNIDSVAAHVEKYIHVVLRRKREDVQWKLASVKTAFEVAIRPRLDNK